MTNLFNNTFYVSRVFEYQPGNYLMSLFCVNEGKLNAYTCFENDATVISDIQEKLQLGGMVQIETNFIFSKSKNSKQSTVKLVEVHSVKGGYYGRFGTDAE